MAVLEEPSTVASEIVMGLIRGPGKAVVEGESQWSCPLVFLFRCSGLEEPFTAVERGLIGLDRSGSGRSWSGREQRPGDVTF